MVKKEIPLLLSLAVPSLVAFVVIYQGMYFARGHHALPSRNCKCWGVFFGFGNRYQRNALDIIDEVFVWKLKALFVFTTQIEKALAPMPKTKTTHTMKQQVLEIPNLLFLQFTKKWTKWFRWWSYGQLIFRFISDQVLYVFFGL